MSWVLAVAWTSCGRRPIVSRPNWPRPSGNGRSGLSPARGAGEVLAPADERGQDHAQADLTVPAAEEQTGKTAQVSGAAKAKPQVSMWREGLAGAVLSVDYQRILTALADRHRLYQGPLICQELAVMFGMEVVSARVEALRSKAKRPVARGWLAEPAPGRFTLAAGVSGSGGGS